MDKVTKMEEVTFHFIRDEPADVDSFGSHARLASTIADVIRQNADLKVIGLLGAWGSGKSTVVRLVKKALADSSGVRTYCFSYDAWLHQNDPPRRAFLETLIHFLIQEGLTSKARWQPQLDQLNRQVEESETTSTPTLTTSGRAVGFSLLLWPIAFPLLSHDWYAAALKANAPASDVLPFLLGIILLALPFLILIGFYFSWRPIRSPFKRDFWRWSNFSTHKVSHQGESILSPFINKEVQRQRSRVTHAPDPTAIEFQDIFREIMDAVQSDKHRFLFVIDNLDRLPEADAVSIWGTIRSFFLGAHESTNVRKAAAAMPTVILPIDETAVCRMYSISHGSGDAEGLAKSFMEKTFDLTFRVTRPVLSDWNSYLADKMKGVFGPTMPPEWPYITSRLYERYFVGQTDPNVTPRTINSLINTIATFWMQWRDSGVSFASVAYYSIYRESIDENILAAVVMPVAVIADLDSNWQRAIAALHYGASPADAAQILIEQPLRKAITEKNAEALAGLRSMPSFDRVLLRIFDQFAADGIDAVVVLGAAVMFQSLGQGDELWRNDAWRRLLTAFRLTAIWRTFGAEEAEGIKALVVHCPIQSLGLFVSTLNSKFETLDLSTANSPAFVGPFVSAWQSVLGAVQSAHEQLPQVQVPSIADVFLNVAAECRDDITLLKQLTTKISDDELVQELAGTLLKQAHAATAENKFLALLRSGRTLTRFTLTTAAVSVIRENATHPGMSAALLILGLLQASDDGVRKTVQTLVTDGHLVARLDESYAAQDDVTIARSLALLLLGDDHDFSVPDNGNWGRRFMSHPDLANLIDTAYTEFGGKNEFQRLIDAGTSNAMLSDIVRMVVSLRVRNRDMGRLHLKPIIVNLPQYFALIDETLHETFLAQVARYNTFWDKLKQEPFEGPVLTLLRVLIARPGELGKTAQSQLCDRLNATDAAKWDTAIRSNCEPFLIAGDLARAVDGPVEIGSHLYDALQLMIPDILGSTDANLRSRWFSAATCLDANARGTLLRNLRDAILSASSIAQLPALLTASGAALNELGFAEKVDDSVRHVILPLLTDATGVDWLVEHTALAGEWIRGAMPATARFLNDRLAESVEGTPEQTRKDILQILRSAWSPANDSVEVAANDREAS